MKIASTILVAAITLMAAEQASAQSNYWDARPISKDKQEQPTNTCLLYTSPSPRDKRQSRMPSSA